MPNSFTPDGSGINDVFAPKGAFIDHYEMKIFDRWGEKLYDNPNSKGWNGKDSEGKPYMEGCFIYIVIAYGYDNVPHYLYGNVTLLR